MAPRAPLAMFTATTELFTLALTVLALLAVLVPLARSEQRRIASIAGWYGFALAILAGGFLCDAMGRKGSADVLKGLSVLGQGACLVRLGGILCFHVLLPRVRIEFSRLFQEVLVAAAVVVWFVTWLRGTHGVELSSLVAPSAVVTAILGLSLQDTLGNIIGGVALQFEESIRVDDWIKVDDLVGRVSETHWRYTAVETRNWETVVIPNSQLLKSKFVVLGRRQNKPVQLRRWVWFNIDFRQSPPRVQEVVLNAVRGANIPNVAADPPPSCVLMDFSESYARYALRYHLTDLFVDDPTDSEVRFHVFAALARAGITPSIPAHAIFLTKETAHRKERKAEEALQEQVALLSRIDLFKSLSPEELMSLARRLHPAPFIKGDVMTRQGAQAHFLYVIVEGEADVVVERADGAQVHVRTLGPGSIFGEMSLLTGEPRTATVIARSPVECLRLEKDAFYEILKARPAIAEEISTIMHRRVEEQLTALRAVDAAVNTKENHGRGEFIRRIRDFFSLDAS